LEFAAGAFFPLDVLPVSLRKFFETLPFASLLHFPLNIYLERFSLAAIMRGIGVQIFWIILFVFLTRWIWRGGLRVYTAHGG
jgi:ABC-2 type transport system permease protein